MKTFAVFDVQASLIKELPVIEAKTSREALEMYLFNRAESGVVKRSGTRYARFSTTPVVKKGDETDSCGRTIWWELTQS